LRISDNERKDIRKTVDNLLHSALVSEIKDDKFMLTVRFMD